MPDYRQLNYGEVLPPDFLEALQQFIGLGDYNFRLDVLSTSVVQVSAGTGNGQVGLGISGLWRYITAPANTSVTGAAGIRDICAVCSPNSFTGVPEVDGTNYAFTLQAPVKGVAPTVPTGGSYRKVGEVDWSGTAITALRSLVGGPAIDGLPGSPTLRTIGAGAQQAAAGNDPRLNAEVLPGDLIYSAAAARAGALLTDGASYLRTAYPALFAAISTTYGSADGTHFNVPNYTNRVVVGAGGLYSRSTLDGFATHQLTKAQMPRHQHGVSSDGVSGAANQSHRHNGTVNEVTLLNYPGPGLNAPHQDGPFYFAAEQPTFTTGPEIDLHYHNIGTDGSDAVHNNMQPFGAANIFIKY